MRHDEGQPPGAGSEREEGVSARAVTAGNGPRLRVVLVVGTRPEAIKLAPVILELERHADAVQPLVVTTAVHREMLARALDAFHIRPHIDLALIAPRQAHADFVSRALMAMTSCFSEVRPDIVLVQGDASTVIAAALAAHYLGVPVGHVEAGIRSGSARDPFPEELNRRLAGVVADLHFAPTERCRANLLREGVAGSRIHVTGNTVVDAVRMHARRVHFDDPRLNALPWEKRRVVLVTMHRRESIGTAMVDVCRALSELTALHSDLHVLFPLHLDPRVRDIVVEELGGQSRIDLLEPLGYPDLLEVIRRSEYVITDSAGIQEECAVLARPVLIARGSTDRPEVLEAGLGQVVGTATCGVVQAGSRLLDDPREASRMSEGLNPFGDGCAATRIVQVLLRQAPRLAGGQAVMEGPALLPPSRSVER